MKGLFDLAGKTALVTGSSRGIGTVLARGLIEAGAEVVLNGRDGHALDHAQDAMEDLTGVYVRTAVFDVTDEQQVERAVAELGPVDILVNNTGVHRHEPLFQVPIAKWHGMVKTSIASTCPVAGAVGRGMAERGHGKIVNVCSVQNRFARPGGAAYAASKGGVAMLTKSMCAEWAPFGVCVNGLAPGYVVTELTEATISDLEIDSWIRGQTQTGRRATVEDLVGTLVWLAAPASDFVSGQVISVDGGVAAVV